MTSVFPAIAQLLGWPRRTRTTATVVEIPAAAPLELVVKPMPLASTVPSVLSPSSLNCFVHDCQVKWYFRKVLQLPEIPGAALGLGKAVHEAVLENFRQKIETKEDLPTDGVVAMFRHAMTAQLDTIKLAKGDTADDLMGAGEMMTRVYMDQAAQFVDPAAVELHVEGKVGDVRAHGYIDILTTDGKVIDIKTAKKKPSGVMPSYRLQVATYSMLTAQASGEAQVATLTKTKTVALYQQSFEIGEADRTQATRLYSIALDAMRGGVYLPNRQSFLCSRKYCSYWERCEAEYGGCVSGEAAE